VDGCLERRAIGKGPFSGRFKLNEYGGEEEISKKGLEFVN